MVILSRLLDTVAIKTIEVYQQHLSPIKGFKCAAGQLYGGTTCSGAVKNIIHAQGMVSGLPAIYRQFCSCHQAAKTLANHPTQPMSAVCCCVLPIPL
ncbi:membrane protein insertion efficiency factor YidD [Acinetobacter sp. VNH17]|uniref:Membrane protein insertion efficiency factor YidD n=1 Tax=Acinetobacter thutiue TaxID=2998078 RepID=A0ABT7WRL9_9GAMM|nr:membrane protein insertion efficiency factor YidD [Acinetobacter thutiue]MCY6413076.1 membrane protein insertion efficiency factor YidD [Acinetobacter thutiue]MDN0015184.1 membrane protein insertion efficiency factor YidD [Acinetobacter thutiue]